MTNGVNRVLLLREWLAASHIGSMEQLFCEFRARFAEILFVEELDIRVVVRLTEGHLLIDVVEDGRAFGTVGIQDIRSFAWLEVRLDEWLTTTVDAATWAAHDLDKGIVGLAFADLVEKSFRVLHAAGDGDFDLGAVDDDFGFFDRFKATDAVEIDFAIFFASEPEVSGTESSFHDTAGDAEDDASAGILAEEILIEFLFGELIPDDARTLDHVREFAGGDDSVDVGEMFHCRILRTDGFVLLRGARHDGDDEDVFRIQIMGFGEVGFDDRAFHLVRRFAGRDMRNQIAVEELHVVDPARRAGSDLREDTLVLDAEEELLRLFHDGEVSAEVGIEDAVEAQTMEGSDHLAGAVFFADLVAEFLSDGRADGRSGLDDDIFAGGHGHIDFVDLSLLRESAGRANLDALAALDARNFSEGTVRGRSDDGVEATLLETEDADALGFFAPFDAAAAEDALAGVADDARGGIIIGRGGFGAKEAVVLRAGDVGDVEEFALAVFHASLAILGVIGEKEFDRSAASGHGFGRGDFDFEASFGWDVGDWIDAGGEEPSAALGRDFNQADAAAREGVLAVLPVAEGWDIEPAEAGGFQHGEVFRNRIDLTFDLDVHHFNVFHSRLSLFLADGTEAAATHTGAALDALALIDDVWLFARNARDAADRAIPGAERALLALLWVDPVLHELLANMGRALLLGDVGLIFFGEVVHGRENRVSSGLAKGAEGADFDDLGQGFHFGQGVEGATTFDDFGKHLVETLGADTAWRALAAALVADKRHIEVSHIDSAVIFVHNDRAAGTHHGSTGNEGVIVDRGIEVFLGQAAAGRTAGLDGFEGFSARDAAADIIDKGAEGGSHRDFDETNVVDLAAEGEYLGAFAAFGAVSGIGSGAFAEDEWDLSQGFDVVDAGWLAPKTLDGWEWWAWARHTTLAFDGIEQGGFFAADERTGAQAEVSAEAEVGTEDVIAKEANGFHVGDGTLETFDGDRIFSANVEVTFVGAECVAGDHHTFDDLERVAFEDGTIHECARVAFVTVADDVFLVGFLVGGELPFSSGGEAATATTADTGSQDFVDDFLRGHGGKGTLEALEALITEGFF